jgi:hypothetical protein
MLSQGTVWARETAYPAKNIPGHPIGRIWTYEYRVLRHVMGRK